MSAKDYISGQFTRLVATGDVLGIDDNESKTEGEVINDKYDEFIQDEEKFGVISKITSIEDLKKNVIQSNNASNEDLSKFVNDDLK